MKMNTNRIALWLAVLGKAQTALALERDWAADLSPKLSANTTVSETDVDVWMEECMKWFDQVSDSRHIRAYRRSSLIVVAKNIIIIIFRSRG